MVSGQPLGTSQEESSSTMLDTGLTGSTENTLYSANTAAGSKEPIVNVHANSPFYLNISSCQNDDTQCLPCKTWPQICCPAINFHCTPINKAHCQTESPVIVSWDEPIRWGTQSFPLYFLDCPSLPGQLPRCLQPSVHCPTKAADVPAEFLRPLG